MCKKQIKKSKKQVGLIYKNSREVLPLIKNRNTKEREKNSEKGMDMEKLFYQMVIFTKETMPMENNMREG